MVLTAVICSTIMAFGAIYLATVDVVHLLENLLPYANAALSSELREDLRTKIVTNIIKAIDGYLIAGILLIFAFGFYELFISRAKTAEEASSMRLHIQDIDDLKNRIARLILLVLVIEFFQHALQLQYANIQDLLFFAFGILLIGGALFLSSRKSTQEL